MVQKRLKLVLATILVIPAPQIAIMCSAQKPLHRAGINVASHFTVEIFFFVLIIKTYTLQKFEYTLNIMFNKTI
jgi:hypothetical protein